MKLIVRLDGVETANVVVSAMPASAFPAALGEQYHHWDRATSGFTGESHCHQLLIRQESIC